MAQINRNGSPECARAAGGSLEAYHPGCHIDMYVTTASATSAGSCLGVFTMALLVVQSGILYWGFDHASFAHVFNVGLGGSSSEQHEDHLKEVMRSTRSTGEPCKFDVLQTGKWGLNTCLCTSGCYRSSRKRETKIPDSQKSRSSHQSSKHGAQTRGPAAQKLRLQKHGITTFGLDHSRLWFVLVPSAGTE